MLVNTPRLILIRLNEVSILTYPWRVSLPSRRIGQARLPGIQNRICDEINILVPTPVDKQQRSRNRVFYCGQQHIPQSAFWHLCHQNNCHGLLYVGIPRTLQLLRNDRRAHLHRAIDRFLQHGYKGISRHIFNIGEESVSLFSAGLNAFGSPGGYQNTAIIILLLNQPCLFTITHPCPAIRGHGDVVSCCPRLPIQVIARCPKHGHWLRRPPRICLTVDLDHICP